MANMDADVDADAMPSSESVDVGLGFGSLHVNTQVSCVYICMYTGELTAAWVGALLVQTGAILLSGKLIDIPLPPFLATAQQPLSPFL